MADHSAFDDLDRNPVLIAIVSYRNPDDILCCLSALALQTEKRFFVSICENGGANAYDALINRVGGVTDRAVQRSQTNAAPPQIFRSQLRPHGQNVFIHDAGSNLGYAGGINLSLTQFNEKEWSAIWILNPDTEPHPAALSALIAKARRGYSVVGGRIVLRATGRIQSYGGHWRKMIARGLNIGMNAVAEGIPNTHDIESKLDYVSGASLFATRNYVRAVGLMEERYFLYCEEVDWCLRHGSHRLGYAHHAIVVHSHGTTLGSSTDRLRRSAMSVFLDERNRHLLTRRFFPWRYPIVVATSLILTLQYLKAGAYRNFLVALAGWWAGLCGKEGPPKSWVFSEIRT